MNIDRIPLLRKSVTVLCCLRDGIIMLSGRCIADLIKGHQSGTVCPGCSQRSLALLQLKHELLIKSELSCGKSPSICINYLLLYLKLYLSLCLIFIGYGHISAALCDTIDGNRLIEHSPATVSHGDLYPVILIL